MHAIGVTQMAHRHRKRNRMVLTVGDVWSRSLRIAITAGSSLTRWPSDEPATLQRHRRTGQAQPGADLAACCWKHAGDSRFPTLTFPLALLVGGGGGDFMLCSRRARAASAGSRDLPALPAQGAGAATSAKAWAGWRAAASRKVSVSAEQEEFNFAALTRLMPPVVCCR